MNPYLKNLNRIEFVVTLACSGRCKHCSEGEHAGAGEYIEGDVAARLVKDVCENYKIQSLMTFGGEPLLRPDVVCQIHSAAREMQIPKRQLITNGFFSKDPERIKEVAVNLGASGVTDILLSVDAFHQETIPLEPVRIFAEAVKAAGVPIRLQPAWLVSEEDNNPYNLRTREILAELADLGIAVADGNVIFPSGNALKYLGEYFDPDKEYTSPYEEDPADLRTISVSQDGAALNGNVYEKGILELIEEYVPVG